MESRHLKSVDDYIKHIERYEKHPIVTNVLAQETTFKKEVECFYNLSMWIDSYGERKFNVGDKDLLKIGKSPIDLVEILGDFSEDLFDTSKLQYGLVREDCQRWKNIEPRKIKRAIICIGGMFTGLAGSTFCVGSALCKDLKIAVPAGVITLVGGLALFLGARYELEPKGTNYESKEYIKLHKSAERADEFVDKHYKNYFIKKMLSIKSRKPN